MERAAIRSEIEDEREAATGTRVICRVEPTRSLRAWIGELRETAALSAPLILTSIAQMAINATTTMMVGHLGA